MLAGVGGQHGWRDPILWTCVCVWLRRCRRGSVAARRRQSFRSVRRLWCVGPSETVRRAARRHWRWGEASVCSRPGARLGAGAGARTARPHFAGVDGGARRTRRDRELVWGVAFPETRGVQLQKKACAPPSKSAPRWRVDAPNGGRIKAGLIRGGWSSSMRPAPRPI